MSEATNTNEEAIPATDTTAQQGDTVSDGVNQVADTTLLGDEAKPKEENPVGDEPSKKGDLLGEAEQQESEEQAPEKYEPFTLADGKEMDAEEAKELIEVAKELNLSQESAQKAALVIDKMVQKHNEQQEKMFLENETAWKKQDPTGELTALARKAVDKLGPEVRDHFKENNYLADARIMSLLSDYGRLISEGKSISGKPAQAQSLLYPNTPELYNTP